MIKSDQDLIPIHLERTEEVTCAGVLITRNLLLTARNCVHGPDITTLSEIEVTVGFNTIKEQVEFVKLILVLILNFFIFSL